MTLSLVCPSCAQPIHAPDHADGRSIDCPGCRHRFVASRDELEDTVAGWIVEDVETFLDDRHDRIVTDIESKPRRPPKPVEPKRRSRRSLYPTAAHGGPVAQERWSERNHGPAPHGHRWERLSVRLRRRLQSWAKLKDTEVFRHFCADIFCDAEHRGDEGVILTDRRLIFHHGHKRGEAVRWTPDSVILINTRGANAVLTLVHPTNREHIATLDHASAERLCAALKRGGGFTVNHADE
ncbi:MAG: hypothetical protein AAGI54_06875 [Planctomycetota bacterium]